jgi:galactoside O-acetyltransferase
MGGENERDKIDSIGQNTVVHPGVEILIENRQGDTRGIFIGSDCIIYPRNRLVLGDMGANPQADMRIGDRVLINAGGYLSGEGGLFIGDFALIGPNVCILSAGHQYKDPHQVIQRQGLTYGPIHIGRDAWIGGGAVVLEGVSIGDGAVIGAGSVICKDVPPGALAVGNPGRVIKYRGREDQRTGVVENFFKSFVKLFR